ncbi:MAG: hypothetical protein F4Z39_12290, partial [Chloroflexi bacterium]|nr:hypothetical protein [Chloroflexota bacterium]
KDSDDWQTLGNVTTYTFSGLSAGTSYSLQVRASNAAGDSSAVSLSRVTLPAAPTSLTTSDITQTAITLSWTPSTGATAYKARKDSGDSWTTLGNVAEYTFTGLTANTAYSLELRASNASGDSATAMTSARTLPNAPAAPTGLTTSGITASAITLNWSQSTGATAYKVRKDSDDWQTLGNVTTYTFSELSAGTSYSLQVRASNAGGDSSAASLSRVTLPAAPTSLSASGISDDSITLEWTKSDGTTGYKARKDRGDSWTTLEDVDEYEFTGLTANTAYTLEVRASNSSGDSTVASISATTLVSAPTSLSTSDISQTEITLSWTKSTGATTHRVRKASGDSWTDAGDVNTYTFTNLTADTEYTLEVVGSNSNGDSATASVTVSTLPNAPATPTALTTGGITQTSITLSWTKSPGATYYKVRVGTTGNFTTLADISTYTFTSLSASTAYTLQVVAGNSGGESSPAQTSATTNDVPPPPAPAAPTLLNTSGITQSAITLNWTKSNTATAYKVRKDSDDSWTILEDVATYEFTGLSADTDYTLEVVASNAGGDSAAVSIDASTLPNAPATPTSLNTSGITKTTITLNWTQSEGATAYKVRKDSNDSYTPLGDVATYIFTNLTPNTGYTLEVVASNTGGDSTAATISATTLPNAPATPTSLSTSGISDSAVTLEWTKSTSATSYKVRKASGDSWTALADVDEYEFTGLSANTQYTLEVVASNTGGDSTAATISATTLPNAPATPTSLSTSGISDSAVTLEWTKSTSATSYKVRKASGDSWTALADVDEYEFTGLSANTDYTLEVLASNSNGDSEAASIAASTLPNAPAAPVGVNTSGITQNSITLNWTKSAGATSYDVNGGALSGWTDAGDVNTYTFTGLSASTAYTLQVRASNAGGDSAATSISATTNNTPPPPAPAAPTNLSASAITQTEITLSWAQSTGATSYKVRKDSGDLWTNAGNVATYTFTSLTANTQYTLEVVANNAGGDSSAASVNASTLPNAP